MVDSDSDSNVNESCWKWKLPRFSSTSGCEFHELTSEGTSAESLDTLTSNLHDRRTIDADEQPHHDVDPQLTSNNPGSKFGLRLRRRSVGDTSESLDEIDHIRIPDLVVEGGSNNNSISQNNNNISGGRATGGNNQTSSSSNSSSGFLSFLGLHFNKSSTRHLERNSGGVQTYNSNGEPEKPFKNHSENRYTRFPVTGSNSGIGFSGVINCPTTGASPVRDSIPFDSTHIHLTPEQTSCFSCSARRTALPSVSPHIHRTESSHSCSTANFLTSAVSSVGRKSKVGRITKQLKAKSRSDNSLHKLTVNAKSNFCSTTTSGAAFYPSAQRGEQKLNSVQQGDHATVRLPWTGFQQNNLSSVTTIRSHPNTHTNFEFDAVRYVESESLHQTHQHLPDHILLGSISSPSSFSRPQQQQRSRSLDRASNSRIFPLASSPPSRRSNNCGTQSHRQNSSCGTNSIERQYRSRLRETINFKEQEILLRNICRGDPLPPEAFLLPVANKKPQSLRSNNATNITSSAANTTFKLASRDRTSSCTTKSQRASLASLEFIQKENSKPPVLTRSQQSTPVPKSSLGSSDSASDSGAGSISAPPSPPPRPASTLKPNKSRLVVAAALNTGPPLLPKNRQTFSSTSQVLNMNSSQRRLVPPPSASASSASTHFSGSTIVHSSDVDSTISGETSSRRPAGGMSSLEDARNSGFINKPTKGWLHSDQLLTKEGVSYTVRYIGCLDVNTSMKSLDFDTRSLIAKECINQVCESAGLKSVDRKRKIDRRLARILGLRPRLDHAGSDVRLTITSTCLKLTSLETGAVIAVHDMPNISFASGGDVTMLDFVAYVAKDSIVGRACFVLECGSGHAQDVITTVGQAFELRFKEYLQKRPPPPRLQSDDPEYYNDLPGKLPPDMPVPQETHRPLRNDNAAGGESNEKVGIGQRIRETPTLTLPASDREMSVNLIDFEAPTPPAFGPSTQDQALESLLCGNNSPPPNQTETGATSAHDPFDMQPFDDALPTAEPIILSAADQKAQLEPEPWFHGVISRSEAEALLQNDGDFLVRESQASPGQYVLTGLQNGCAKHLLLVDPEGVVRTKDRTFQNVTHLIRHHSDNNRPIISAESLVLLRHPVPRVISS